MMTTLPISSVCRGYWFVCFFVAGHELDDSDPL